MSDDLIRLQIQADAANATGAIRDVSASADTLGSALKDAGAAGIQAGNEISEGMEKANFSMMEARHGAMLLGEEIGVKIPRALSSVIAHSETFGRVFAAAFSTLAVVGFLELAEHVGEKLSEWIEKTFIFTDAMKELDKQLLSDNKKIEEMNTHVEKLNQQLQLVGESGSKKTGTLMGFKEDEISKVEETIRRLSDNRYMMLQAGEGDTEAFKSLNSELGVARAHLKELAAEQGVLSKTFDVERAKEQEEAAKKAAAAEEKLQHIRERAAEAYAKSLDELKKEQEKQTEESAKLIDFELKTQLEGEQKLSESIIKVGDAQLKFNLAQADAAASSQQDVVAKDLAAGHTREAVADQQKLVSLLELEKQAQLAIVDAKLAEAQAAMDVAKASGNETDYNNALADWEKYQAERVKAAADADKKIAESQAKMLGEEKKELSATVGKFNDTFAQFFVASADGHERLGKIVERTYTSMANTLISNLAKATMAEVEGMVLHKSIAKQEQLADAKAAAAGAYKAMSGIPVIGPEVGAVAAAATFAAAMAFAQGGIVPDGGPDEDRHLALLRPNEMVLPPAISQTVQDMAQSASGPGGGVGGSHIHIHAMDSNSFEQFLKRNPSALSRGISHASDNGHLNVSKLARGK